MKFNELIANHPHIGREITYRDSRKESEVTGTVTGVRHRSFLLDTKTNTMHPGVQLRIKPADGSRAFWTATMRDVEKKEFNS